jgi:hypothetical protein
MATRKLGASYSKRSAFGPSTVAVTRLEAPSRPADEAKGAIEAGVEGAGAKDSVPDSFA